MAGRPQQYSALRRAFSGVLDWVMGKKIVGKDAAGNVYYRWLEGGVERREVQWSSAYMYYDPHDIPAEWRMWLRKLREEPPTEEEMRQNAAKQVTYQARVAALEEAERLRRLRQQTVGTSDQHAGAQPDMARFLQQMSGRAAQGAGATPSGQTPDAPAASPQPEPGAGAGTPSRSPPAAGRPDFQPETWRPGN